MNGQNRKFDWRLEIDFRKQKIFTKKADEDNFTKEQILKAIGLRKNAVAVKYLGAILQKKDEINIYGFLSTKTKRKGNLSGVYD